MPQREPGEAVPPAELQIDALAAGLGGKPLEHQRVTAPVGRGRQRAAGRQRDHHLGDRIAEVVGEGVLRERVDESVGVGAPDPDEVAHPGPAQRAVQQELARQEGDATAKPRVAGIT